MREPDEGARIRIAVLFGGPSSEHDVSCGSAASIVQFLDRDRFEVTPIRVTRDGMWAVGKDDPAVAVVDVPALLEMTPLTRPDSVWSLAVALEALSQVDVVLPAFHGRFGADGTVQALLELIGVPYVGNGIASSAVAMDKAWTKVLLSAAGLVVADGVLLEGLADDLPEAVRDVLGLPVFVKPAREGSSIGVSRVDQWSELDAALAIARECDSRVLVEAAVSGREVDIAVLQRPNGEVVCGPPLEIRLEALQIPADLDPEVTAALQEQAIQAFRALGCTGLLRVDFFLRPNGDRLQPIVNEVNTFPGFTSVSQYPQIWKAAGLDFTDLLSAMVDTALATVRPGAHGEGTLGEGT